MGRTVAELEQTLTYAEWVEWLGLYRFDPWDDDRRDFMLAQLTAAAFNPHVDKDHRRPTEQFLPMAAVRKASTPKPHEPPKTLKERFQALVRVSRKPKP